MRLISLDTETTGLLFYKGHRIVEIGCIEIIDRQITSNQFHTYLNPLRSMDYGAKKVTGLTDKFLKNKPKFNDIVNDFFKFLRSADGILIHNAQFDVNFINNELQINNCRFKRIDSEFNIIDTLILARQKHPRKKNNLDALCKRYNIKDSTRTFHGALLDALLLANVYLKMTHVEKNMEFHSQVNSGVSRNKRLKCDVIKATKYELKKHMSYMDDLNKYK